MKKIMTEKFQKIPTIILTGFLGAGKTTLLNRLIERYRSQRTVLLINEFGQIGIDGELLVAGNYTKIELNKGSLFCICVRTDFIFEVEKIARDIQPELLIIEATGLADTSEMEKMLALPNLIDKIHLQSCVCLVDCVTFPKIKNTLRAPLTQIEHADLILVNKIDLVPTEHVQQVIAAVKAIAPATPIITTRYADFHLAELDRFNRPAANVTEAPGEGRPDLVVSITLAGAGSFTNESWEKFRDLLQPQILRLKGFLTINWQTYHVDATFEQWELRPTTIINPNVNRLVVIGQNLDEDKIKTFFSQQIKPGQRI